MKEEEKVIKIDSFKRREVIDSEPCSGIKILFTPTLAPNKRQQIHILGSRLTDTSKIQLEIED
jgi:hypothetical protein